MTLERWTRIRDGFVENLTRAELWTMEREGGWRLTFNAVTREYKAEKNGEVRVYAPTTPITHHAHHWVPVRGIMTCKCKAQYRNGTVYEWAEESKDQ